MAEPRDMDEPVTRRELHEALEIWGEVLADRIEARIDARLEAHRAETRAELQAIRTDLRDMEGRLHDELARHSSANRDELTGRVNVVDEQYRDLPARVTRLEATVFAPKRKRGR